MRNLSVKELSNRLGVAEHSQDWGILNADEKRLSEFIDFFNQSKLSQGESGEMIDLIFASANERLLIRDARLSSKEAKFVSELFQLA